MAAAKLAATASRTSEAQVADDNVNSAKRATALQQSGIVKMVFEQK
jgi:hypothetical protein